MSSLLHPNRNSRYAQVSGKRFSNFPRIPIFKVYTLSRVIHGETMLAASFSASMATICIITLAAASSAKWSKEKETKSKRKKYEKQRIIQTACLLKAVKRVAATSPRCNGRHHFYERKTKCEIRNCSGSLRSTFDSFPTNGKRIHRYT